MIVPCEPATRSAQSPRARQSPCTRHSIGTVTAHKPLRVAPRSPGRRAGFAGRLGGRACAVPNIRAGCRVGPQPAVTARRPSLRPTLVEETFLGQYLSETRVVVGHRRSSIRVLTGSGLLGPAPQVNPRALPVLPVYPTPTTGAPQGPHPPALLLGAHGLSCDAEEHPRDPSSECALNDG